MSQIYAIRNTNLTYQELDLCLTDLFEALPEELGLETLMEFSDRNIEMLSWWNTPYVDFLPRPQHPDGEVPDISFWNGATLVLSPRAFRFLSDSLTEYGEFLPVDVSGETYRIFNCLRIAPADELKSEFEYEGDMKLGIKHLELIAGAEKNLVFKTPLEACLTVFCNQQFKDAVETFELTGVAFDSNLLQPSPFE